MFTDLAVIDWIALAFASVLLAAACAAVVIAYATSSNRSASLPPILKGHSPAHAVRRVMTKQSNTRSNNDDDGAVVPDSPVVLKPPVVPQEPVVSVPRPDEPSLAATPKHALVAGDAGETVMSPVGITDPDRRLAERAALLRGRPIPEERPAADSQTLRHKVLVQSVVANRTPAHAKTLTSTAPERGVAPSNFDRTEGFKARTPGFFDDPMGRHELRYWDGHAWTEYVKEHGERFTDPL